MEVKKENGAVDIAKLIMALLVIVIHKPVFDLKSDFLNYISGNTICAVAVPFFFVASSYFFFLKAESNNRSLLLFEKRLFKLYFFWTIIYLPCIFVKYNTNQYDELSLKILIGQMLVTVKNFFLSQSFVHLWYVNTLMISVAIIFFLYKKLNAKYVFALCIIITVISNVIILSLPETNIICKAYNFLPTVLHNTFEKGLLCTSGGFLLSKLKSEKISYAANIALLSVSFSLLIINGIFCFKYENPVFDYFHTALIFANALLIFNLCVNIKTKPSKAYYYMRKYSTVMYFSHLLLMSEGFRYISYKTGIAAFTENELLIFFTTLLFAVIVSTVIVFLSEKPKFEMLKNLY